MRISTAYPWIFLSVRGKMIAGRASTLSSSVSTIFAAPRTSRAITSMNAPTAGELNATRKNVFPLKNHPEYWLFN
jgi:hypothetical protein